MAQGLIQTGKDYATSAIRGLMTHDELIKKQQQFDEEIQAKEDAAQNAAYAQAAASIGAIISRIII